MALDSPLFSRLQLPLRVRLTLWMVLLFLVVQVSLVFVLQMYQRRSINEYYDDRIVDRQAQVAEDLHGVLPALTDATLRNVAQNYERMLLLQRFVILVFDARGQPLASSHGRREALPPAVWERLEHATRPLAVSMPLSVLDDPAAPSIRSAAGWTAGADGKPYLVLVAWSDTYATQMHGLLSRWTLFTSIPIGVVAMIVSAWMISGVAVKPILEMRNMARGLEPDRLGERLPESRAGAEINSLREDLEATRQRLDAAFSVQERFMSNVSHEFKTPIAVLTTEAQMLRLDGAGKDVRDFVASAMDELGKLGRTVDSFLLLTRVRHGKATIPNRELCLARDIMSQSYEGCAPMASQYGVRLLVNVPDGEHLDVGTYGNCDLLRTILDNLVRNAIRFSPPGNTVEVDGRVEDGRLIFRVRDTGPGIPAELLPKLFNRFSQSVEEQKRGRGHGLGLQIAMGITEMHGGTITAANHPEGGCEFTVSLPVADGDGPFASPGPRGRS